MSAVPPPDRPYEAIVQIPSCALDRAGVLEQQARLARLRSSVVRVEREPGALLIELGEGFDRAILDEVLAVERACCPFLAFEFTSSRRLRATVREAGQVSALDAIAHALGAAQVITPAP